MSPTRKQSREAAAGELRPCALCGKPRWFHAQSNGARRALDWRDDGHIFKASMGSQMRLPFELREIHAGPNVPAKKPPQRLTAPRAKKKRKSA